MIATIAGDRFVALGRFRVDALIGLGCGLGIILLWVLLIGGHLNLIFALVILAAILFTMARNRVSAALLTLVYVHLLGDVRRLADVATGVLDLDLLLLVAPCAALLLALPVLMKLRVDDALSKAMLVLTVLMVLAMFNPLQGGLAVGVSGALFYLVPVLWFWIGRELASPEVIEKLLYRIVFPLAVCAALLGLWQTLVGFFPYEQAWIDATLKNYMALSLGGSTRAFGFSVSAAEYATLLELAAAGVAAAFFTRRRIWALAFPLLLSAMLLASGRTVVVKLVMALAVAWSLRKRHAMSTLATFRTAALIVIGLVGVSYAASFWAPTEVPSRSASATQESLAHLSGGLAHPLDERYSTVSIHQGMFLGAIASSFTSPLGHGLGSTTGASGKFSGSSDQFSSEIDVSDMFIVLGPVGGILYLFVFIMTIKSSLRYLQGTELSVGLPVVAILVATVGAWLIAGQYSTSALVFFLIGATKHPNRAWSSVPRSTWPVAYGVRRFAAS